MPRYEIKDPADGTTLLLEGDSPPTELELERIFKIARLPSQEKMAETSARETRKAKLYGAGELAMHSINVPEAIGRLAVSTGGRLAETVSNVGRGQGMEGALKGLSSSPNQQTERGPMGPGEKGLRGIAQTAPVIAGAAALQAQGAPSPLAFGLLVGSESLAEGEDAATAIGRGIVGAAVPASGTLGKEVVAKGLNAAIDTGLLSGKRTLVQKAIEALGAQGAMQVFMAGMDFPQYAAASPEERKKMLKENILSNSAWLLMELPGMMPGRPSQTQSQMPPATRAAVALHAMVNDPQMLEFLQQHADRVARGWGAPVMGELEAKTEQAAAAKAPLTGEALKSLPTGRDLPAPKGAAPSPAAQATRAVAETGADIMGEPAGGLSAQSDAALKAAQAELAAKRPQDAPAPVPAVGEQAGSPAPQAGGKAGQGATAPEVEAPKTPPTEDEIEAVKQKVMAGVPLTDRDREIMGQQQEAANRRRALPPEEAAKLSEKEFSKWTYSRIAESPQHMDQIEGLSQLLDALVLRNEDPSLIQRVAEALRNSVQLEDPKLILESAHESGNPEMTLSEAEKVAERNRKFNAQSEPHRQKATKVLRDAESSAPPEQSRNPTQAGATPNAEPAANAATDQQQYSALVERIKAFGPAWAGATVKGDKAEADRLDQQRVADQSAIEAIRNRHSGKPPGEAETAAATEPAQAASADAAQEKEGAASENITLYRAGDASEKGIKKFSSWTPDRETAQAYQDNPGFGGATLRTEQAPKGKVLDANTTNRRGMSDLAQALGFTREEGDTWFDNGWRYPWEESAEVKKALEASGYDWIKYPDDFPEGATTLVSLKDIPEKPSAPPPGGEPTTAAAPAEKPSSTTLEEARTPGKAAAREPAGTGKDTAKGEGAQTGELPPGQSPAAMRKRVGQIADRINRIQKSIPVGETQVPAYLKEEWDALWRERDELGKKIAEAERPAREQADRERGEKNGQIMAARDKRVAEAPVFQRRNGWEIVKEGADYVLRDPNTKGDIYRGKLRRVREVADESTPETPAKPTEAPTVAKAAAGEDAQGAVRDLYENPNATQGDLDALKAKLSEADKDKYAAALGVISRRIEKAEDLSARNQRMAQPDPGVDLGHPPEESLTIDQQAQQLLIEQPRTPKSLEAQRAQILRLLPELEGENPGAKENWRTAERLKARLGEIEKEMMAKRGAPTAAPFPTLLEYAKSRVPKSAADRMTSEAQAESFRLQWEKERRAAAPQVESTKAAPITEPRPSSGTSEPLKEPEAIPFEHPEPGTPQAEDLSAKSQAAARAESELEDKLRKADEEENAAKYGTKRREAAEKRTQKLREQSWTLSRANAGLHQRSREMGLEHLARTGSPSQKWAATAELLGMRAEQAKKQSEALREKGEGKQADIAYDKAADLGRRARAVSDEGYGILRAEASRRLQELGATKEEAEFEALQTANMQMSYPHSNAMAGLDSRMKVIQAQRAKARVESDAKALMDEFGVEQDAAFRKKLEYALPDENRAREIIAEQRAEYKARRDSVEAKEEQARMASAERQRAELEKAKVLAAKGKLQWTSLIGGGVRYWKPVEGKPVKIKAVPDHEFFVYKSGVGEWSVTESSSGARVGGGKTQGEAIADAEERIQRFGKEKFDQVSAAAAKEMPPKPDVSKPAPEPPAAPPVEAPQGPGLVGMGGATPSEFGGDSSLVSNMFAVIDADREARGLEPMPPAKGRSWDQDEKIALDRLNKDPDWIPGLIRQVAQNPRPLLSWEQAGMVFTKAKWKAEQNNALRRIAAAFEDGRQEDLASAKVSEALWADKLQEMEDAVGRRGTGTGSEAGRSLQAQKMGVTEDFDLAEAVLRKEGARGGKRLSDREIADLRKQMDEGKANQEAYERRVAELEKEKEAAALRQAMEDARRAADAAKAPSPYILKVAERIGQELHTQADAARKRVRERLSRMNTQVDPTLLSDLAIIGADHIYSVGLDAAKWSARMVEELGDWVKPHLDQVFKASQAKVDEMADKMGGQSKEAAKRKVTQQTPEQAKDGFSQAIKENLEKNEKGKIAYTLQKLARMLYESGITEREAMVDALTEVVQGDSPQMTRQEVARAWSGYGDYRQLSKEQITVALRGMKGELQQIAKLEDMQAGKPPLKSGVARRETTEAERKLIQLVNNAKNKFQIPITDPQTQLQSPLDTLKKAYTTRMADYQERLSKGDFAPRPRREIVMDPEATRLKAAVERIRKQYREGLIADRLKNRTRSEKLADWLTKFRRAGVLTSPAVIPKLISAGAQRLASLPIEEAWGGVLGRVPGLRTVASKAPMEGGGANLKAEMRGFGAAFSQGMKDAYNVLKTGHSELDVLYGKAGESYSGESELGSKFLELPGRVHGMIKAPIKRAVFERSVQRLGEFYARQGLDPSDPVVLSRITVDAYKAANRAIFLQDNWVASKVSSWLAEHVDKQTGHATAGGKVWSTAGRIALPITRVPLNIVSEMMQYIGGSASGGGRLLGAALGKGVESLTPEQSDIIMRHLKKGSVGMAVLALGYYNSEVIGGYYQPGKKKDPKAVGFGKIRVYGREIPSWLLHNPLLETLQFGATVRKVAESHLRKKDSQAQGLASGVVAAALGMAEEVPFVRETAEIEKARNPYTRSDWFGEQLKSIAVPGLVQRAAQWTDSEKLRKPKTPWEHVKMGIPGLRQTVMGKTDITHLSAPDAVSVFEKASSEEKKALRAKVLEKIDKNRTLGWREKEELARRVKGSAPANQPAK